MLGEAGVCDGAAAEIRVVSVTSLLAWAVTISAKHGVIPRARARSLKNVKLLYSVRVYVLLMVPTIEYHLGYRF